MKKIALLLMTLFLTTGLGFCADIPNMPSDEEILEQIRKYNTDPSKEEYLLQQVKERLNQMGGAAAAESAQTDSYNSYNEQSYESSAPRQQMKKYTLRDSIKR